MTEETSGDVSNVPMPGDPFEEDVIPFTNWIIDYKRSEAERARHEEEDKAFKEKGESEEDRIIRQSKRRKGDYHIALRRAEIYRQMLKIVGDWPKRINETVYIIENEEIRECKKPGRLMSWIEGHNVKIDWKPRIANAVSQTDFFDHVHLKCKNYRGIETLPHYPKVEDVFYHHLVSLPKTGFHGALDELLSRFNPATAQDKAYLKALFLTVLWGGPGGSRPGFVLMAPDDDREKGRGVGKTAITDALALLYGICIDFKPKDDRDAITKRLLTSASKRLIRFDNVQSKLANADVEGLITAQFISGHKMWAGDDAIPNLFTWVLTFNQADFSKDMAQRALPIRLARPQYDPDWWAKTEEYIKKNRERIIADTLHILKSPATVELKKHFRFAVWSKAVLSRCTTDAYLTDDIIARQKGTEFEDSITDQIFDIIDANMTNYAFWGGCDNDQPVDWDQFSYRIKSALVTGWVKEKMPWMTGHKLFRLLDQEKPDWLRLPLREAGTDIKLSRTLGTTIRGTLFLEISLKPATQHWLIEKSWRAARYVDKRALQDKHS